MKATTTSALACVPACFTLFGIMTNERGFAMTMKALKVTTV